MDKEITRLNEQVKTLYQCNKERGNWCEKIERDLRSLESRVDGISELKIEIKHMSTSYAKIEKKLDRLLEQPSNNMNAIKVAIISSVLGGVLGYMINQLM